MRFFKSVPHIFSYSAGNDKYVSKTICMYLPTIILQIELDLQKLLAEIFPKFVKFFGGLNQKSISISICIESIFIIYWATNFRK